MLRDWPRLVLRLATARGWDGRLTERTFVLGGSHESRITMVAQQVRAINLAVALQETGRLERPPGAAGHDQRGESATVAVVGAGAAGATFAAAAASLGARVTLFDEHEEPISTQRWSFERYLHPNLFDWPIEGFANAHAELPVVDWQAAVAARARLQMLADFALTAERWNVRWCSQHSVSEVRETAGGVVLTVCDLRSASGQPDPAGVLISEVPFDLVVVAGGFLPEPPVASAGVSGSYWKDVDIGAVMRAAPAGHTIVGDGDGALTELLRLSLERAYASGAFRQEMLEDIAAAAAKLPRVAAEVLDVEARVGGGRAEGTLGAYAGDRFRAIDDLLDPWRARKASPYSIEVRAGRVALKRGSFALNRVLAARLSAGDEPVARFVQGEHLSPVDVAGLAPSSVIWRAGARRRHRTVLVRPALATRDAGDALAGDPARQDVLGTVDELMDVSREERWNDRQQRQLRRARDEASASDALDALVQVEQTGTAASAALTWNAAAWPAFVDEQPDVDLLGIARHLARLAAHIGRAESPAQWSNFVLRIPGVLLSLDLVAVAADLTPTEVVHRLRRTAAADVGLEETDVRRGRRMVRRLWVYVSLPGRRPPLEGLGQAGARSPEELDWTLVSLLLAPGFADGDVFGEAQVTDVEESGPLRGMGFVLAGPARPIADPALRLLVAAILEQRDPDEGSGPSLGAGVRRRLAMVRSDGEETGVAGVTREVLDAVRDRDPAAERVLLNVVHRALGRPDDWGQRAALVELGALVQARGPGSPVLEDFLSTVLHLPRLAGHRSDAEQWLDPRAVALLDVAYESRLFRQESSGDASEESKPASHYLALDAERLDGLRERLYPSDPHDAVPERGLRLDLAAYGLHLR